MASEHWRNCDFKASDAEILEIDLLEERLGTKERHKALKIRRLITSFEVCHHNSLRWAERIVEAIADGTIPLTSGRKRSEHPISIAHLNLRELLTSIADDTMESYYYRDIPAIVSTNLQERLGHFSHQKRWLIKLVLDNLEHHLFEAKLIPTMRTADNRMFPGGDLNIESGEDTKAYFSGNYKHYTFYKDTSIRLYDVLRQESREMSLLLVIQFINPCSVNYFQFVSLLLDMLTGVVESPEFPFPFCGHYSERQYSVFNTYIRACQIFLDKNKIGDACDTGLFGRMDECDLRNRWLIASFEKTLKLQLGH